VILSDPLRFCLGRGWELFDNKREYGCGEKIAEQFRSPANGRSDVMVRLVLVMVNFRSMIGGNRSVESIKMS
jgi:hypothetical protein